MTLISPFNTKTVYHITNIQDSYSEFTFQQLSKSHKDPRFIRSRFTYDVSGVTMASTVPEEYEGIRSQKGLDMLFLAPKC